MNLELFIKYTEIKTDLSCVRDLAIDYADSTLRGCIYDGILTGNEVILIKFSDYGIFLDNRYGKGYEINKNSEGIIIQFKNKK